MSKDNVCQKRVSMWIVTKSYNDYNQHGEYFVACYTKKPNFDEFLKLYLKSEGLQETYFDECVGIEKVKRYYENKGRYSDEDCWYNLREIKEGELYSLFN